MQLHTHYRKSFYTPQETLRAITVASEKKARTSVVKTLLSAFIAGGLTGMGGLCAVVVAGGAPALDVSYPSLRKLLFALVYPIGLWFVVSTGVELFVSNTMFMTVGVLQRKVTVLQLLRNWALVWVGNFVGSVVFAALFSLLPRTMGTTDLTMENPTRDYALELARQDVDGNWGVVFVRGIGCGWLVTMAVFAAVASGDMVSKLIVLWPAFAAFSLLDFQHTNSNMFFLTNALMYGADTNFGLVLALNIIPTTLGNAVGGTVIVGLGKWYLYLHRTPPPPALDEKADEDESVGEEMYSAIDE